MLRCPEIVEALGTNPLTGRSVIDRILSFLGLQRGAQRGDRRERRGAAAAGRTRSPTPKRSPRSRRCSATTSRVSRANSSTTASNSTKTTTKSLHSLVQKMTVFEKVKLARVGNKEARGLLVRDRNKLVAAAAVRSPKVTDNEILAFAKARNVSDEVLRIIARNPDWTRNYQVKLALTANPRCPQQTAIKFLNYLQDRELRGIMKSKEVPSAVATHARRILQRKGK